MQDDEAKETETASEPPPPIQTETTAATKTTTKSPGKAVTYISIIDVDEKMLLLILF